MSKDWWGLSGHPPRESSSGGKTCPVSRTLLEPRNRCSGKVIHWLWGWESCLGNDLLWSGCLYSGESSSLPVGSSFFLTPLLSSLPLCVPSLLSLRLFNLSLCSQSLPGNGVRGQVQFLLLFWNFQHGYLLSYPTEGRPSSCHYSFCIRRCLLEVRLFERGKKKSSTMGFSGTGAVFILSEPRMFCPPGSSSPATAVTQNSMRTFREHDLYECKGMSSAMSFFGMPSLNT